MHDPISYFQAIVLGLVQGVSELFPISSLGHAVVIPRLFGWNIHQNAPYFLTFLVALHLATALVLLAFFWRDWVRIVKGIGRSLRDREIAPDDADAKLGWLLVVGTIPAGILGLTLQDKLRSLFASPQYASIFLALNALVLLGAELLRRRAPVTADDDDERIARTVGWRDSALVGAAQALALIPGFSRSGASMGGGLLVGLSHKDAARFAFLLATPIIIAAAVLKLPDLAGSQGNGVRGPALVGALCSAVTAFLAVRFLMRYFETNTLLPFAIYCAAAGTAATIYFAVS
jgi:undecaprenyl-diphosphatase